MIYTWFNCTGVPDRQSPQEFYYSTAVCQHNINAQLTAFFFLLWSYVHITADWRFRIVQLCWQIYTLILITMQREALTAPSHFRPKYVLIHHLCRVCWLIRNHLKTRHFKILSNLCPNLWWLIFTFTGVAFVICHVAFLISRCARTEQSPQKFYSCAKPVSAIRSYTLWSFRHELNSASAACIVTPDTNVYTVLDKPGRKCIQKSTASDQQDVISLPHV